MRVSLSFAALSLATLLSGCGEPADTRPGQPVAHRKEAFNKILHAFEPMGIQIRNGTYNADKFLASAQELVKVADGPWQYFGPDTLYPPTHANEKVWSEPERFEEARKSFIAAANNLLLAAQSKDAKLATEKYNALHEQCRSCHKRYKD